MDPESESEPDPDPEKTEKSYTNQASNIPDPQQCNHISLQLQYIMYTTGTIGLDFSYQCTVGKQILFRQSHI